jgi:beta-catenin-like protein 1
LELAALHAKLKGGGDLFHRVGAIAAFCCVGSKRCHQQIIDQLTLQQSGIGGKKT